jgi:lysophospholipase L1-like esterase
MTKSIFAAFLWVVLILPMRAGCLVQPNDVVGITGDSITQAGIYPVYMKDYMLMCQPTSGQSFFQSSNNGEQASDLLGRLNINIFPFRPTILTTLYGMNDGHYGPITDDIAAAYRKSQTGLVETLKKNGVRVVVIGSPKCVDTYYYHRDHPGEAAAYNQTLAALAAIDKDVAAKENAVYADVFDVTLDAMKRAKAKFGDSYQFAGPDGIHPQANCQLVLAFSLLKAMGYDGNIGTITVEPGLNQAEATSGHEIVSCQNGVVTVKSTRYPFCFQGAPDSTDQQSTAATCSYFPEFNDQLNRFMLVVKGLRAAKAKVTWGNATREYTADQLAKGINLAAEFLQNPFADQFTQVNNSVLYPESQQGAMLGTSFMPSFAIWGKVVFPGADDAFKTIINAGLAQHQVLVKAAAALVVPVQYVIKIEPEN